MLTRQERGWRKRRPGKDGGELVDGLSDDFGALGGGGCGGGGGQDGEILQT